MAFGSRNAPIPYLLLGDEENTPRATTAANQALAMYSQSTQNLRAFFRRRKAWR
jgi:hypothetical protein